MKILFASDMSFADCKKLPGREESIHVMEEAAEYFKRSDFSLLNLENVLGEKGKYSPIFKSGPNLISEEGYAEFIHALRPTAVALANNHAGDYGEGAVMNTLELLRRQGYQTAGAGCNIAQAYEPLRFEKEGIKVCILAVCENEFGCAGKNKAGSAGYSWERVKRFIDSAQKEKKYPVIFFHGGNEGYAYPSPKRTELYRNLVDRGACAVIAMHSHCPQGYEIYKGAPIVYSMGNFYFPSNDREDEMWYYGYMCSLEIEGYKVTLETIPYSYNSEGIYILKGQRKERFQAYMERLNKPIANEEELQSYFDSWCVISGINGYLNNAVFRPEMLEEKEATVHLKNLFCCESHNELVQRSLEILYEGRYKEAGGRCNELQELQNPGI